MELIKKEPSSKGTPDRFIGEVYIDRLAGGQPGEHLRVNVVRFAPGARNAWHAHALGQTLHVTEGVGRVQARGADIQRDPRRRHDLHAARRVALARRRARPFMTHLAMWEAPAEGARVGVGRSSHRRGLPLTRPRRPRSGAAGWRSFAWRLTLRKISESIEDDVRRRRGTPRPTIAIRLSVMVVTMIAHSGHSHRPVIKSTGLSREPVVVSTASRKDHHDDRTQSRTHR